MQRTEDPPVLPWRKAGFVLRLATARDVPALMELIETSVHGLQAQDYTIEQRQAALGSVFTVDSVLIQDGTFFVVEWEDEAGLSIDVSRRIAAAGGWSRRRTLFGADQDGADPASGWLDPRTDAARIRAFFVHPDFARRGLGTWLLELCESEARRHGFTRLELVATLTGESLYRRAGYSVAERQDIALPGGVKLPVVNMTRRLPGRPPGGEDAGTLPQVRTGQAGVDSPEH